MVADETPEPTYVHRFSSSLDPDAPPTLRCQSCPDDMADFMPVAADKIIRAFVICVDCHRLIEARDRLGFRARSRLAGATDVIADKAFDALCAVEKYEVI